MGEGYIQDGALNLPLPEREKAVLSPPPDSVALQVKVPTQALQGLTQTMATSIQVLLRGSDTQQGCGLFADTLSLRNLNTS